MTTSDFLEIHLYIGKFIEVVWMMEEAEGVFRCAKKEVFDCFVLQFGISSTFVESANNLSRPM